MPTGAKLAVTSISDIARLAGVSASTVSRALSGSTMISVATRARINDLAREHGFQLNQMARNLRLRRTNAIGVVLPLGRAMGQLVSDPFFLTMLGHLADGITVRGYDVLIARIVQDEPDWLEVLASSGRVDGLILIGQSTEQAAIERVAKNYRPMVVWGEYREGQGYCSVGTDNVAGGAMASRHLLGSGRKRLLFAGDPDIPEIRARHAGFLAAHREVGIEPHHVLATPLSPEGAYRRLSDYLAANEPPDGIVAASDVVAAAAIRALGERGLSVPDAVSVVGYDDVPMAAQLTPRLTTVRQDLRRGAEELVDRLFRRLDGDACDSHILPAELVVRGSAP